MKFCTNCGAKMQDEDLFCTNCGSRFSSSATVPEKASQPVKVSPKPLQGNRQEQRALKIHSSVSAGSKPQSIQKEIGKAREILFPNGAMPDYTMALSHLIQAKKLGARPQDLDHLMLADQLYRTLDLLRQEEMRAHPELNGTAPRPLESGKQPVSMPVAAAPAETHPMHGGRSTSDNHSTHSDSKHNSGTQTGNYLKAAAVGAVTGALAQAATRAIMGPGGSGATVASRTGPNQVVYYDTNPSDTSADDDMLALMDEDAGGTLGSVDKKFSAIPTAEAADVTGNSDNTDDSFYQENDDADDDDSSYQNEENDNSSYEEDDNSAYDDSDDDSSDDDSGFFDSDDDGGSFFDSDDDLF